MRISDWSSDVCSSDLLAGWARRGTRPDRARDLLGADCAAGTDGAPNRMIGWFKRRMRARAERSQVDGLIDRLDVAHEDRKIADVFPIILPGELVRYDWPGQIVALEGKPFAMTLAGVASPDH